MPDTDVLFEVGTPLGFSVRVTRARWELITTNKHPVMAGRESSVRVASESPEEIRQSRTDPEVPDVGCAPLPSRPAIRLSWSQPTQLTRSRKEYEYGRTERALRPRGADPHRVVQ